MAYPLKKSDFTPKTQKTFNKIIKTAEKEFSLHGYLNTSIHTIAKKAKLSVGCIYKYFENKDDLYQYIISREQLKIREHLKGYINKCKTRKEKEKEGLRAWLHYVRDNPGVYRLIWETLFIDKKAFDDYYVTFANSYVKGLIEDKDEINNDDYLNIAYMLIGISNFLGIRIINSDSNLSDEDIDKMVETADKFFTNGVVK